MKLKSIELKNYKAHKHFIANFDGENKHIQGNKGSGKTSIMDAFKWLMTGTMVDDPMPVDENGKIIDHQTVMVRAEFMDGTSLKIESSQKWSKDVLKSNHTATYYTNDTPCILKEYQSFLDDRFGTLEQRKIMVDPSFFAHGDGLAVTSGVRKTATQRRREIVISVAGAENLEKEIAEKDAQAKQAKHAITTLKKEVKAVEAGVDSLEFAKIDTKDIKVNEIEDSIAVLSAEKSEVEKQMNNLENSDNASVALQQEVNKALMALSDAQTKYSEDYAIKMEKAREPYNEYLKRKSILEDKFNNAKNESLKYEQSQELFKKEIANLEQERLDLLEQYNIENEQVYIPNSMTCPTCQQALPISQLESAEATFNKHKSEKLENIRNNGKEIVEKIKIVKEKLEIPYRGDDHNVYFKELELMVEPVIKEIPKFENTVEYATLSKAVKDAREALEKKSNDSTLDIYKRKIDDIDNKIKEANDLLKPFSTNEHLDNQIKQKSQELQDLFDKLDEQQDIVDDVNDFMRETIASLEASLEEKFDGIKFQMFTTTLDGEINDTCITYAKTSNGYIPWESLSGGQKRSATIKLANAFAKAWDVKVPLFIDDTQIYVEDEIDALMQLIRITEVPNAQLEIK